MENRIDVSDEEKVLAYTDDLDLIRYHNENLNDDTIECENRIEVRKK